MKKVSRLKWFWTTREFILEVYLTMFTIFFRAGSSSWPPSVNATKAVSVLTLIECLFLLGVTAWIDPIFGKPYLRIVKWKMVALYALFFWFNRYLLVRQRNGVVFEQEFSAKGKSRRVLLLTVSWLIIGGTWLLLFWGAFQHHEL